MAHFQQTAGLFEYTLKLKNILGSFGLKNVIKRPTTVTDTTKTIIDRIIVSDTSKLQTSGVLDYKIADHKFVYAILKLRKKNTLDQLLGQSKIIRLSIRNSSGKL